MPDKDSKAPRLTGQMRVESMAARGFAALPARAQLRLAGGEPVVIDGQTLDPASQLVLALIEKRGGDTTPGARPIPVERKILRRQSILGSGDPVSVKSVRNLQIDGAEGKIGARFYATPERGGPHPLLVYYHGGGFVLGDLDSHDGVCRSLCVHGGVDVLAVDYRLAPEHPFPAGVDDARAAFEWAQANAADLGSDPTRIAVAGDSAGGNLAAVTAMTMARSLAPPPIAQLLIYPITDYQVKHPSYELVGEGFLLSQALMEWFGVQYLGGGRGSGAAELADPRLSPLQADDCSGLPRAVVATAGFDPLRDEGEAYAGAMQAAGCEVIVRRFPDLIHGFASMSAVSPSARSALVELGGLLRALVRS